MIKSPSDTTIYAPALTKQHSNHCMVIPTEMQISNLVGNVRAQMNEDQEVVKPSTSARVNNQCAGKVVNVSVNEQARKKADNAIIEAEKFRAEIATPPAGNIAFSQQITDLGDRLNGVMVDSIQPNGASVGQVLLSPTNIEQQHRIQHLQLKQGQNPNCHTQDHQQLVDGPQILLPNIGMGVSDDDFFHLTCHIEPGLIAKIEKGEFVELEKLLPKDRSAFTKGGSEENRLEWVQRDGNTYLDAAGKDMKITGIRRWEQAFRAYATIYCAANPQRSKEIWQYISVINTAASAYSWDNVYNYDITFRHLMAFNPNRSWAVTYNQMWNLSMRDPIPRNHSGKGHFQFHGQQGNRLSVGNNSGTSSSSSNNNSGRRKSSDYCWNFNKGIPCKFGKKCRFIERCKYCDSTAHGIHVCPKLEAKKNGDQQFGQQQPSTSK